MAKDVSNQELLEAIKGVSQQVKSNSEAIKGNSKAIRGLSEQVAKNAEAITGLQSEMKEMRNDIAHLPEQLAVRNSATFQNHEDRISVLEDEVGIAVKS